MKSSLLDFADSGRYRKERNFTDALYCFLCAKKIYGHSLLLPYLSGMNSTFDVNIISYLYYLSIVRQTKKHS